MPPGGWLPGTHGDWYHLEDDCLCLVAIASTWRMTVCDLLPLIQPGRWLSVTHGHWYNLEDDCLWLVAIDTTWSMTVCDSWSLIQPGGWLSVTHCHWYNLGDDCLRLLAIDTTWRMTVCDSWALIPHGGWLPVTRGPLILPGRWRCVIWTTTRQYKDLALPCLSHHRHMHVVLVDRWGATDGLATSSLHTSHLSVFLMAAPSVMPVHSGMLSSHLLFCQGSVVNKCLAGANISLQYTHCLHPCKRWLRLLLQRHSRGVLSHHHHMHAYSQRTIRACQ